jgi:hypothetical protein
VKGYSIDELLKLASYGGGFSVDARAFSANDLFRLASYASDKGSRITIRGAGLKFDDMLKIAAAGKGAVFFEQ